MSKPSRSKAQAARDKKALKTLKASGLYSGKTDLRRSPTPYQKSQIRRFADVITGKATVVRPKSPSAYRGKFDVKGDKVIVPRAKGERIGLSKTGKITRTRKTPRGPRKATIIPVGPPKPGRGIPPAPPPGKALVYYLPFRRGSGKGQTTQWMRFSYDKLVNFFIEYDLDDEQTADWLRYLEIEEMSAEYERELDRYITGQVSEEPAAPIPHSEPKFRSAKRRVRRGILFAQSEEESE
jgi:hypothetical protein